MEYNNQHIRKMIRVQFIIIPILLIFGLGNCGILGGDDKDEPINWVDESLDGLVVYGFTGGGNVLHMINLENEATLNIYGINGVNSVAASSDGSNLFISSGEGIYGSNPGSVVMIDTQTWTYNTIFDQSVELLSVNNEIFFITKLDYLASNNDVQDIRTLGQIDSQNGNIILLGEIDVFAGGYNDYKSIEISSNSNQIFALDSNLELIRYDINSEITISLFNEIDFSNHAIFELSEDAKTLFFSGGPVLDLNKNSEIGFIHTFKWGQPVARKDKKEIYITGPDDFGVFGPSLKKITVYNPQRDALIDTLDVNSVTDQAYLSPQERYLISHSWINLFVIDLKTRELIKSIPLGEETSSFEKIYLLKKPLTKGDTNGEVHLN
jgi:hypothetical protein